MNATVKPLQSMESEQGMDTRELRQYLHEHIPLSRAMEVEVLVANKERVKLVAPLAPNINHRDTVFGGSASALAILSAWSLLHVRLNEENLSSRIVIQKSMMNFERPIVAEFMAESAISEEATWLKFLNTLRRKGRARISIAAEIYCKGENAGAFEGVFVALCSSRTV